MEERLLTAAGEPAVRFYFDPVSPYAWLAMRDLPRLDAGGVALDWVPILFAGLLETHGNLGPAEIPVKRRYLARDVEREATRRGLPFRGPPGHPFNPLLALRMCTATGERSARARLALALTTACWERGEDISQPDTAARVARDAGFDGSSLVALAAMAEVKEGLVTATAQAAADGVFGVPTFRIDGDDELFWGADRIDALLWRLGGHAIDETALAAFLGRAPLAVRRRYK
jgi:2-hydroxychromene-2-carboxylate isomerase